jgi:hypothetical protein
MIAVLLSILFLGPAMASAAPKIIGKGIKAGINVSRMLGSDISEFWVRKKGLAIGGFLVIGINEHLAIQPEILFSQKGVIYENIDAGEDYASSISLSYVDVPILANFYVPMSAGAKFRPYLFTGPSLGLKIRGRMKTTAQGVTTESEMQNMRMVDMGLMIGAGLNVDVGRGKIGIDVRHSWSLASTIIEEDVKTSVLSILLSYSFN